MLLLSASQIVTTMSALAKQPSATPKTPGSAAVAAAASAADGSKTDGTATGKAANGSYKSPAAGRLFTFGVCTDVQYADLPEGKSHGGTARFYRDSLNGLRRAVQGWKDRGVEFGMHLGDVVDGKNPKDCREAALADVLGEFSQLGKPVYHMIGNHCLYNFPREELNERLNIPGADGNSYYSFSPHEGWRLIVLDSYDISMLGWPPGHPHHEAAKQILDEENINEEKNSPDGMVGPQRRFVKFGGGMSDSQLEWLQMELARASQQRQRVIVFCHQPLHPDSCTGTTLAWTYKEVMSILQSAGNVAAAFAGHTHTDGYGLDDSGIHYRALNAILETTPGRDCYGFIDVYEDRLDFIGVDNLDSMEMPFPQPLSWQRLPSEVDCSPVDGFEISAAALQPAELAAAAE